MDSYVYFISDGKYIKIGKSAKPMKRLEQLQTSNARELKLLGIIPGSSVKENELHSMFNNLHVRGEWFKLDNSILLYIESIGSNQLHKKGTISLEEYARNKILTGTRNRSIKPEYKEYIDSLVIYY